jgi:two-component system KDP operon response regulator KdpE
MRPKVLVVDDEPQIRRALSLNLGARGYEVFEAATGEMALAASATEHPDIVLLDLGLPGIDGASVLAALRGYTKVPVIVLTVRDDERSKVQLLDAGADDYITKPFGMGELVARMGAVLRRVTDAPDVSAEIVTDDFRLDLAGHRAFVGLDHAEVRLTPLEWAIVIHLVRNPNRLITYRQLVTAVWGPTFDPDTNLLRVHMTRIRHKLEPRPSEPRYFVTDAGSGYRFQVDDTEPALGRRSVDRRPEEDR